MHVKYIKLGNNTYCIVCHMSVCLVFNQNLNRRLFMFEIAKSSEKKAGQEGQMADKWFTCSSKAYDFDSGEEFIAVATNEGRIYKLKEQVPGQFTKEIAFTMGIISPITTMTSDAKSRHLLIGLGGGEITLLKCSLD